MSNTITVTKASGERSLFLEEKIRKSLARSGAEPDRIDHIIREIKKQLYDGMSTGEIYKIAFSLLKDASPHQAARYHLKEAIMELGPSGFPFEKYVARLLQYEGYSTQTGITLQGKCVSHEIDVIARGNAERLLIECKFHNRRGLSCNVKIPLYIHARFNDVQAYTAAKKHTEEYTACMIVTNTRFTVDAVQYAGCSGIRLLGWDQPFREGLKDLIDRSTMYPVTCMTSLTAEEKKKLLDRDIVLCSQLSSDTGILWQIGVRNARAEIAQNEARHLCERLVTANGDKP